MQGKLATIIDRIEHGHHVFRAYFKHAFLKQYEKFSTFLRNELVSNNLADFRLKKGLDHLEAVRQRFQTITARFAGFQAQWLNVHVDFPLLQRLTPVPSASSRSSCMAAVTSAAGRQSRFTTPFSPASISPRLTTASISSAMTLRKLKGHDL